MNLSDIVPSSEHNVTALLNQQAKLGWRLLTVDQGVAFFEKQPD